MACASATDRFNDGLDLEAQGRYMEAAYRYADAVEKDASLQEARDRLLIVGDSAIMVALEEADYLAGLGEPDEAARQFLAIDRLMSRVRSVGMRLTEPDGYRVDRRTAFERAIEWYMTEGEDASREGRWEDAIRAFASVRGDFSPTREQREASFDAQTRVMIDWAEIELADRRPRAAYAVAERALSVRRSTPRPIVLEVSDLQDRALAMGRVVVAALPVSANERVREVAGTTLEIELDRAMESGQWRSAPPFVAMADANILRRELRGLLRGVIPSSPALVGRALDLIGADYGVMVELVSLRITDEDVEVEERTAVIRRQDLDRSRARDRERGPARDACYGPGLGHDRGRGVRSDPDGCRGRGWGPDQGSDSGRNTRRRWVTYEIGETVTYWVVSGERTVRAEADVLIVNLDGRAIAEFTITSRQDGSFQEGEFDGDPWQLGLNGREARLFDFDAWADEWTRIQRDVIGQLADGITVQTFRAVLSGVE
jgi:tetratricopeptide (TPR) repeat protein